MDVEQSSAVESQCVQTTVSMSSSTVPATSPKISMFGSKSGFVIPKNKLSGALVPIFRGGGKVDSSDTVKEESGKRVQRKTKWGVDLTQDASIRRGRAFAYQTRVEQIVKQLKSASLEIGKDQSLLSPNEVRSRDSSGSHVDELEKCELLELEKREAIGEILHLNPSYKAPADYKPLLKEAKVPIPLKAYPGYNFINLILGPESNMQRRLEEETGAKVRIHGSKADTGEKKEITRSQGDEDQATYAELYVHISADTFEKVDAAVALIELLVTPISASSVSSSTASTSVSSDQVRVSATSYVVPVATLNQGLVQPMGSVVSGPQVQFQPYQGSWFPLALPRTPLRPPSGFIPPLNSAPMPNNSFQFPPSAIHPFNATPFFGVHLSTPVAFGSAPGNPPLVVSGPQQPMQVLQRPYLSETNPSNQTTPVQNHTMPGQQPGAPYPPALVTSGSAVPRPFTANQAMTSGPTSAVRPPVTPSMLPVFTVSSSGRPPSQQSIPMPAGGNSSGWSGTPNILPSLKPSSNMMQMAPHSVPQSSLLSVPQPVVPSSTQSIIMPGTVVTRPLAAAVPPSTFLSRPTPQLSTTPVIHPVAAPTSASGPHVGAHPPPILSSPPISAPPMISNSVAPVTVQLQGPAPRSLSVRATIPAPPPVFSQAPALVNTSSASILGQAPTSILSSSPVSIQPLVTVRGPTSIPSPSPGQTSAPVMLPVQSATGPLLQASSSVSGSVPSFSPMRPLTASSAAIQSVPAPKPQRPSSSDFTFQPQRPQPLAVPNNPRPTSQAVAQNTLVLPTPGMQRSTTPHTQPFRPAMNLSSSPTAMPGFTRFPPASQMGQHQAPNPPPSNSVVSFANNQPSIHPSPALPFPNPHPGLPSTPTSLIEAPSFVPAAQAPNLRCPLPIRPGNQLPATNRPGGLMLSNQQLGNNLNYVSGRPTSSPAGGNQIYDPFSPTSISSTQQQGGRQPRKQETDAEYEDLMASVGVR